MRAARRRSRLARHGAAALVALPLLVLGGCTVGPEEPGERRGPAVRTTEILWDTYGVPHVFARNPEELFHAFGRAQAEAHGELLLRLMSQARGRAAETWGPEYVGSDAWVWMMDIPGRAARWYGEQSPPFRRYLDAFATGINEAAREPSSRLSPEAAAVLPVTGTDVLAHLQRAIHFTFLVSPWALETVRRRWLEGRDGRAAVAPSAGARTEPLARSRPASNAWAVGPSRSETGHALLLANPHLPWSDLFVWFEAQLASPEIDAYGAAVVGTPFLGIAFNERLGWTHTVNTHDGADLYELTLAGEGYRWAGGTRPFETARRVLAIRQPDGTLAADTLVVRRSVHGPIVAMDGERALALRVAGLDQPHVFAQYWEMARARDLREFEAAVGRLQMPTFTVMYADVEGNILHLFGGRVPRRPAGPYDWSGIVAGDGPETLWTETHAYEDLPRVLNPASGWLQNANDPPWTTTFPMPLRPDAFPSYLAPWEPPAPRPRRSARMLAEDASISLEEMVRYKHSTRMELARGLVDDLVQAASRRGGTARRAADVLARWDRSADADSRGAVLFEAFHDEWAARRGSRPLHAVPWDPERPLDTPAGLADPEAAVGALEAAARSVEAAHGRLDVAWGELHRFRRDGQDLLGHGGPSSLGIFRVVDWDAGRDGRRVAIGGDSFVAAIEFGDSVRARVLLGYGNASRRGSPHRTDQLHLFARKELRPVWRTREAIEANLQRRQRPTRDGSAPDATGTSRSTLGAAGRSDDYDRNDLM